MERVVYLFGAGASHACVKAVGSHWGILMRDLGQDLHERVRSLVDDQYKGDPKLTALVNAVVSEDADFEHIITFLDQSVSSLHRRFANDLRAIFQGVLAERLERIEADHGGAPPVELYEALIDMYEVPGVQEELRGMLTLNYDDFVERAVHSICGVEPDLGVTPGGGGPDGAPTLLKLHGSFGWLDSWPISLGSDEFPLWIPPGIQKAKDRYPFNLLWGLARELLDCDVLRIVGCRLGPNDWDLISLLFTTRHTNATGRQYRIEVIDSPRLAEDLKEKFPYLEVRSILELEPVGPEIIAEFVGGAPRPFSSLRDDELKLIHAKSSENWFRLWLKHVAETLFTELPSLDTTSGAFKRLLEA